MFAPVRRVTPDRVLPFIAGNRSKGPPTAQPENFQPVALTEFTPQFRAHASRSDTGLPHKGEALLLYEVR